MYCARHFVAVSLSVSLLIGCATSNPPVSSAPPEDSLPHSQTGVSELLAFGASMANMQEAGRADVCKSLLDSQKNAPTNNSQLRLLVGRLLSSECGDIPKLLETINALKPVYAGDENMQRFLALHTQVLAGMQAQAQLKISKERKSKVKRAANNKEPQEPKNDENRLLREKLEAIRTLEKQMDETSEGN